MHEGSVAPLLRPKLLVVVQSRHARLRLRHPILIVPYQFCRPKRSILHDANRNPNFLDANNSSILFHHATRISRRRRSFPKVWKIGDVEGRRIGQTCASGDPAAGRRDARLRWVHNRGAARALRVSLRDLG